MKDFKKDTKDMKAYICLLIIFLFAGCAGRRNNGPVMVNVVVDAYGNDRHPWDKKYILVPENPDTDEDDFLYIECSNYIRMALTGKGYIEATDEDEDEDIDLVIFLDYGISDPETFQETVAVPIIGQTGVSSTNTTGNIDVNPFTDGITYNQTTTSIPTYGVTGYRDRTYTYTQYVRYISVIASDFKFYNANNRGKTVWKTIMVSMGGGGDLRKVMPYMVRIGGSYFGISSGEQKTHRIHVSNREVDMMRRLANSPDSFSNPYKLYSPSVVQLFEEMFYR